MTDIGLGSPGCQLHMGTVARSMWRSFRNRAGDLDARVCKDATGVRTVPGTERPRAGYHSVTPRIVVADVEAQVEFLRVVFDASVDVSPGRPAEVHIGDSLIMVTPATERELFAAFLYIYVEDAEQTYQRALAACAISLEAPLDMPYGDRRAMVRDPFGNVIQIAHQISKQSPTGTGNATTRRRPPSGRRQRY